MILSIGILIFLLLTRRYIVALMLAAVIIIRQWQTSSYSHQKNETPVDDLGIISREKAFSILGLSPPSNEAEIRSAHRRLIQNMHPDRGGSDFLAAQINMARDILLKKTG